MKRLIFACLAAVVIPPAMAALPYGPTEAELATLPPVCRAKVGNVSEAERVAAERSLGTNNWLHFHHYCYAINFLRNRLSSARTSAARKSILNDVIGDYEYVLKHAEKTFWMRPQIHVELGRVYEQAGQKGGAIGHYGQAIASSPDFQAAYFALIAVQRDLGDLQSALATATEGLRRFPSSKGLKKNYLDLGGKEPFPEPITREAAAPRDVGAQTPSVAPKDEGESNAASVASESAAQLAPDAQVEAADGEAERGCRFCPPEEIQQRWRDSFGEQVEQ